MSLLFSPSTIGSIAVTNRLICSATYESMADEDGFITDELVKRYVNLAKGSVGLVITGYFCIHPRGKAFGRQAGAFDDGFLPGMTRLADEVHQAGPSSVSRFWPSGSGTKDPRRQPVFPATTALPLYSMGCRCAVMPTVCPDTKRYTHSHNNEPL